ncbi:EAL domain-containing protein [Thauera sinica]|uniref:EAL domain-containing protein n=1 Tax=Thauera sinica TaxID=2665146 RepID=A0ABW1AQ94_9RHOO|nr:EAL domain-containing protein [Thauera sp. K11]ATE59518.1 diguanylate phosphodiesterase [Thauera sp. K11]
MPLTELVHYFNKRSQFVRGGALEDCFDIVDGRVHARFGGRVLGTLFQPVVAPDGTRTIGHEAHLQAVDGQGDGLPAQAVFLEAGDDDELVHLDRLARTLHALNFLLQPDQSGGFLSLNVHSQLVQAVPDHHGQVFETVLSRCGLAPDRIVLEISDDGFRHPARLAAAISEYRERGYRIALDNFGRHSSDLDRLAELAPDIVKLDRSLSGHAGQLSLARKVMEELVPEIRRLGMKVVSQCIENDEQLRLARDLAVDGLQGYLIGRPAQDCRPVAGLAGARAAA